MKRQTSHRDDGVAAKKHLGQHFLKDPAVSQRIAGLLSEGLDTNIPRWVLEPGP